MTRYEKFTPIQYDLKVVVNEKRIPMNPFIISQFQKVFFALIEDLEHVGEEGLEQEITCAIEPTENQEGLVKLTVGGQQIKIKGYIQEMIWRTLAGFLSSLKKMPEKILEAAISVDIKKK